MYGNEILNAFLYATFFFSLFNRVIDFWDISFQCNQPDESYKVIGRSTAFN